jgi:hypothetical protein
MSPANKPGGYTPGRLTAEEIQSLGMFFKQLLADNPLVKAAIIAAGIGGAFEILHTLWLARSYLAKF